MKWKSLIALSLAVILAVATVMPALADAADAVEWLKAQQRDDGGFGMESSTLSETAEAIYALAAAGEDVTALTADDNSPLDFLAANVSEESGLGTVAKVAMAVAAAGGDASDVAGLDLVQIIQDGLGADGKFGSAEEALTSHAYAMLALVATGQSVPNSAVAWLKEQQAENGAWAWNASQETDDTDTNSTALAIQALIASGVSGDDAAITSALDYLRSVQNEDGGFPYQSPSPYGTDTDANSTGVVMQAILAAGEDPDAWKTAEGNTPRIALLALQNDSGAFAWQAAFPDDNLLATAQAVPGLLGRPYPIAITSVTAQEAASTATAEPTAAPTVAPTAAPTQPATVLPATGGAPAALNLGQLLVLGGSALAAAGYALKRKLVA